jgi:hypothetical protein
VKRFLLLVVIATSAVAVTAAQARSPGIRLTLAFHRITQGDIEILNATVPRSGTCSLTVRYANGRRQPLGDYHEQGHQVSWEWLVPPRAAVGRAKARVACGGSEARSGAFVVRRRPYSSVAVVQRGFTQLRNGRGGTNISWGVVLVNRSQQEARNVTVYANFLDAAGDLVLTDFVRVAGIAPGATYYAGSVADTAGFPVATRLVAVVNGTHDTPQTLASPDVTNVLVSAGDDAAVVRRGDLRRSLRRRRKGHRGRTGVPAVGVGSGGGGSLRDPYRPRRPAGEQRLAGSTLRGPRIRQRLARYFHTTGSGPTCAAEPRYGPSRKPS